MIDHRTIDLFQKGKFGLFGHKRSKSETEADGFICPLDLALPLDKLKISALQYQGKEVSAIVLFIFVSIFLRTVYF